MNILKKVNINNKVLIISSLRLRKDGIAFYTKSLFSSLLAERDPNLYIIGNKGTEVGDFPNNILPVWERNNIASFLRVHKVIWSINPRIIHLQFHVGLYGDIKLSLLFLFSIYLWKILGKTIVITYHSARDFRGDKGIIYSIAKRIVGFVYSWPDIIVLSSDLLRNFIIDYYGINPNKIFVVPMGVSHLNAVDVQHEKNDSITIFSPAFLRPGLLLDELLYVLEDMVKIHKVKLYLVASGLANADKAKDAYLRNLENQIRDLSIKDNVVFVKDSEIDSEDKYNRLIAGSDILIYLHNSYNSVDAGSISITNAVAFRKTVVVSDVPKFNFIVKILTGNGLSRLVVPSINDRDERIKEIRKSLEYAMDKTTQYRVSQLFNDVSAQMTWSKSSNMLKSIYNGLLNMP